MNMSKGKFERLNACANEHGVITAAAVDHRTPLLKAIAAARGPNGQADAIDMLAFKTAVTRSLTQYASAILLDPEYSLPAISARNPQAGVMLAYEKTGYDSSIPGRLPDLLPQWSIRRLAEQGAQGIKILLYYNPFDSVEINTIKHAYIERIGSECAAEEMPFFLEPIVYDDSVSEPFEFARKKPAYVAAAVHEFSKPRYGVDILKIEIPVVMPYVADTRAFAGEAAYSRAEALELFRAVAAQARLPFIFLSAGVSDEVFREALELAAEAEVPYCGVLCGRATWQGGIAAYAQEGPEALDAWLAEHGVQNILALNEVLAKGAQPWWTIYGTPEQIEVAS